MRIGPTPYFAPQTYQAARAPAATADNSSQQASGSASGGFDFTNISRANLRSTVNSLIKGGSLSLDDSSALVPMMGSAALSYAGTDSPAAGYDDQKLDVLCDLQTGIDGAMSRGDTNTLQHLTLTLDALQRLQDASSGVDVSA
jgi:hypothetical protein